MNFYKHHLGDYDGHTAHLSWDEDMAYTRLLRAYYRREAPIPPTEAYRLARASSRPQRAAVDSVLAEFFTKQDDGWHNKRADEEIAAYQAQAETNRRISRERTAVRSVERSVERSDTRTEARNANGSSTKRPPNQNPEPEARIKNPTDAVPGDTTSEATSAAASPSVRTGQISLQIRALDKSRNKRSAVTSQHPKLLEWAKAGATDEQIREAYDLAASAREADGDSGPINANYLDAFVRKVLNPPASKANGSWWESEQATVAMGREFGIEARPGEEWHQFRQRIREALAESKAAA